MIDSSKGDSDHSYIVIPAQAGTRGFKAMDAGMHRHDGLAEYPGTDSLLHGRLP